MDREFRRRGSAPTGGRKAAQGGWPGKGTLISRILGSRGGAGWRRATAEPARSESAAPAARLRESDFSAALGFVPATPAGKAEPAASPNEAIRDLAGSLVDIAGRAGSSDKDVVVDELVKIPMAGLRALRQTAVRVVVCKSSITEVLTERAGVQPRGWPPGKTWDSVPGSFDRDSNRVIIATRDGQVPPMGDGHGAHNLVIHEVGHR